MKSLWEELENYSASDYYPFHMPGHKRLPKEGALAFHKRLPKEGAPAFHKRAGDIFQYDITEIEGFDNLHDARGLLFSLQQKAARIYRAEQSFFLINGGTGGILSAVSTVAREGMKLLVARNCHKSVYHAVQLNRLRAEYLLPGLIEEFDIQGEVTAEEVKRHLRGRKDICGVVITSPTYDGVVSDIRKIAEEVHACHIPLIVDEAHGAHFVLSKKAPAGAVECGADLVVNSLHKTLPALTQTALLHVQGPLIDRERLKNYLGIYQSSSPSYLLMASIDGCIDFIEKDGEKSYEKLLNFRKQIDEKAASFSMVRICPADSRREPGKLVVSVKNTGMTGWELYRILLQKYHLQMEMAAPSYVLGILTGMDTREGVERLLSALEEIDVTLAEKVRPNMAEYSQTWETNGKGHNEDIYSIIPSPSGLSIYEAMEKEKEWLFPEEAIGRVSGGFLYFYPPGIPLLVPGERIGEKQVFVMQRCGEAGQYLTGLSEEGRVCVLAKTDHFKK